MSKLIEIQKILLWIMGLNNDNLQIVLDAENPLLLWCNAHTRGYKFVIFVLQWLLADYVRI